ncbi:MAG: nucleotidyltransferase domain-containing protein [Candidatus Cloacimonetes bacterium]|nr:nucleotidyltransferase domain-containing protein [Candidatus Cloacimonadota bacterium]
MDSITKYGIKAEYWTQILSILKSNPLVSEVILYGSRAKGNFKPGSDIDICLKGAALSQSDVYLLLQKLDDLNLPWIFDLSCYNMITNAELIDHIERVGIWL